jgi:hypothetical protein
VGGEVMEFKKGDKVVVSNKMSVYHKQTGTVDSIGVGNVGVHMDKPEGFLVFSKASLSLLYEVGDEVDIIGGEYEGCYAIITDIGGVALTLNIPGGPGDYVCLMKEVKLKQKVVEPKPMFKKVAEPKVKFEKGQVVEILATGMIGTVKGKDETSLLVRLENGDDWVGYYGQVKVADPVKAQEPKYKQFERQYCPHTDADKNIEFLINKLKYWKDMAEKNFSQYEVFNRQ